MPGDALEEELLAAAALPPATPAELPYPLPVVGPIAEERRDVNRMGLSFVLHFSPDRFVECVRRRYPNFPSLLARESYDASLLPASRPQAAACRIPILPTVPDPDSDDGLWPKIDLTDPMWNEPEVYDVPSTDDPADADYVPSQIPSSDSDSDYLPAGQRSPVVMVVSSEED